MLLICIPNIYTVVRPVTIYLKVDIIFRYIVYHVMAMDTTLTLQGTKSVAFTVTHLFMDEADKTV